MKQRNFKDLWDCQKKCFEKIFANYSEDLNMACINSDIKLMIVFLLFKFYYAIILYPGANWEFFPE